MGPILSSLVNLQGIETKVRRTQKELNRGQQVIKKQQHRIEQLKAALLAKNEEIKMSRMQFDRLELDREAREDDIAKMRVALNTAKTNKEYSAVLTKINTDKADNSKLEDQILAIMTQIDNDKNLCREIEESIQNEEQRLEEVSGKVLDKQNRVEDELGKLITERKEAYDQVPGQHSALFDRLANRYDGEVLAEVEKLNGTKGNYSCNGCFMKVPLEVANALMIRDDVIICPNCGRMLVMDLNPKQQPTS